MQHSLSERDGASPVVARREPLPVLRMMRPGDPVIALGLAVSHLMTKRAFAGLNFGAWSRILVGQINRGHYYFVVDGTNRIQGFVGWAETTKNKAEAWVEGLRGLSGEEAKGGDCIVFNAWSANNSGVNRFLLEVAREIMLGKEMVYFKRYYANGKTRPVRVRVNDFVGTHVARKKHKDPPAVQAGRAAPVLQTNGASSQSSASPE
jgi:hemolysin-activating ACP:hemolysin acyltransferase